MSDFFDDLFDVNDNDKYDIVDQIAMEDSTRGADLDDIDFAAEGDLIPGEVCPDCGGPLYEIKVNEETYCICGRYPACGYKKEII